MNRSNKEVTVTIVQLEKITGNAIFPKLQFPFAYSLWKKKKISDKISHGLGSFQFPFAYSFPFQFPFSYSLWKKKKISDKISHGLMSFPKLLQGLMYFLRKVFFLHIKQSATRNTPSFVYFSIFSKALPSVRLASASLIDE